MISALLLSAAAAAPADLPPNFPPATAATIEDIRRDPRGWDGKWVRIEGWMHRCNKLDCVVSERPRNQGMFLSFEGADALDAWVQPLLPAQVVVVARINAECLVGFCTDRAPDLRDPYVMTRRWNVDLSQEEK